ncbi:WD40-repeat-containing domain protein, partial [Vararia minispora EC-137]
IYPYAKMASAIIASVAKIAVAQRDRDDAIKDLLEEMVNAYAFVNNHTRASNPDEHRKKLLGDLSRQTVDCAYFIRDYASIKNFWVRAIKNTLPISDGNVDVSQYKTFFANLLRRLTEHGVLEIEIRVLTSLADIGISSLLYILFHRLMMHPSQATPLTHVHGAGLDSAKNCLPGTRTRFLDDLSAWVNDLDGARVRFLIGVAGAGKSAIAHSLGSRFNGLSRLGCFFAFDRNFQKERSPQSVLSAVAHELASWNPDFKHALASVLRARNSLSHTTDIAVQWDSLIIEPAKKVTFVGPILIVIDAFDESASMDQQSRRRLLTCLSDDAASLPNNFRILITSRPEDDIRRTLRDRHLHVDSVEVSLADIDAAADIEAYVRHSLNPLDRDDQPLTEDQLLQIGQKAEGLFQWAYTACRVIIENPAGSSLQDRFERRMAPILHGSSSSLDDLYSGILHGIFPASDLAVRSRFCSVMAQILCTSQPLSADTFETIRSNASCGRKGDVTLVVRYMGAVLSGVSDSSPIRLLHTSFRDFLVNPDRSKEWHVDPEEGHSIMCLGLIVTLNNGLSFNICGLDTSYLLNSDVPNLRQRISSPALSYAAGCLRDHMTPQPGRHPPDIDVLSHYRELFCDKFLLWVELLSVLGHVNTAPSVLRCAMFLFSDDKHDETLKALQDAMRFVRRFAYPISQSAPHVYISALPFAPITSVTRSLFSPKFPHTPKINGLSRHWSRTQTPIHGHSNHVYSVSFSPDGEHILSASPDHTICVWDIKTGTAAGEAISCPSPMWAAAYSPDGTRIASASFDGVIRVWDANTRQSPSKSFRGHSGGITCIAYSPDGSRLASCSDDSTVRIWDAETGYVYLRSLSGHSSRVTFVAFSPHGRYIASGSSDTTICIWDTLTGERIGDPLQGHSRTVYSVAYSPDGRHVISGSSDGTIRIWGTTDTGEAVGEPSDSYAAVYSTAHSPNGDHIVSGHSDGTVYLWDSSTGKALGNPLHGHSAAVHDVAYSPDGRHIASGSADRTARIWNADTRDAICKPLATHSLNVWSISYSPDGQYLVTGSADSTVRRWDAHTGKPIDDPIHHASQIWSIVYSPDGKCIATGLENSTVQIREADTFATVGDPVQGHLRAVRSIAYSPDGSRIASGSWDCTVRIWDSKTHEIIGEPLRGHSEPIYSVAYSPDGHYIASSSEDMTVRIWNASTGDAIGNPFRGHFGLVRSVDYSPDGKTITSGSVDGTMRIWDVRYGEESIVKALKVCDFDLCAHPWRTYHIYRCLKNQVTVRCR